MRVIYFFVSYKLFFFQVKLVEVEKVEWVNKKTYSTVALVLQDRDYRILLRTNEGLEDWFELLEVSSFLHPPQRTHIWDPSWTFKPMDAEMA